MHNTDVVGKNLLVSNTLVKLVKPITSVLKHSSHKHSHKQRQGPSRKEERYKAFTPLSVLTTVDYTFILYERLRCKHKFPQRSVTLLVWAWDVGDMLRTTRHQRLGKAAAILLHPSASGHKHKSHCRFFFWENERPHKKIEQEKSSQIRCLFSRFQNPPDIRKNFSKHRWKLYFWKHKIQACVNWEQPSTVHPAENCLQSIPSQPCSKKQIILLYRQSSSKQKFLLFNCHIKVNGEFYKTKNHGSLVQWKLYMTTKFIEMKL